MTNKRCLNCYYFRFNGIERWCGHPDHHRRIKKPIAFCRDWIWMETKSGIKKLKVTIERSIAARLNPCAATCEITNNGQSILCLVCGRESWNPGDVEKRYCIHCERFHDDAYA